MVLSLSHRFLDDPGGASARRLLATLSPDAALERLASPHFHGWLAEDSSGACGLILMRDTTHLYHLFVREDRQRRGIATALWQRALSQLGAIAATRVTVNAAPGAVAFYRALGFTASESLHEEDGLRFLPMALSLDASTAG
nr:GNAT family N-acetyltransferase [Lysobacter chinensis]